MLLNKLKGKYWPFDIKYSNFDSIYRLKSKTG